MKICVEIIFLISSLWVICLFLSCGFIIGDYNDRQDAKWWFKLTAIFLFLFVTSSLIWLRFYKNG